MRERGLHPEEADAPGGSTGAGSEGLPQLWMESRGHRCGRQDGLLCCGLCSMPSKHPELHSEMGSASSPRWPGLAPGLYAIQFQRPFLEL